MPRFESTNAELIAAAREWEATEFGVHKMMSVLASRLEAAEAELTRRDTVIGHDELSTLCLSYLQPPKFSGGSWTLNPDALATAILERLTTAHPYNPEPTDVEAER